MKAKYWYYKGSDIIDTAKKEQEARELRAKRRKAKALRIQKKISM
jgi:hypothetical protein